MEPRINEYKKALAIGKLGFWEWNAITNATYWGDEKFKIFGFEPQEFELSFENAFKTMHADDIPGVMALLQKKMVSCNEFEYEYRGLHKSGNIINVWVKVEVQRDTNGTAIGLTGISQDITERKKLEANIVKLNTSLENSIAKRTKELEAKIGENEMLVKEMHHRVKNNLQIISSILRLQVEYLDDKFAISSLEECVSRIKSMALIHESLYSRNNLSSIDLRLYFQQLLAYHLDGEPQIKTILELPEIKMEIGKMLPLGMIINELISNSMKHAFKEIKTPTILLNIEEKDKALSITYKDNGRGFDAAEPRAKPSFGMDLIGTLLSDLDASPEFSKKEKGFSLDFSVKL